MRIHEAGQRVSGASTARGHEDGSLRRKIEDEGKEAVNRETGEAIVPKAQLQQEAKREDGRQCRRIRVRSQSCLPIPEAWRQIKKIFRVDQRSSHQVARPRSKIEKE